ncbi:hypothetical protein KZZ52_48465 [Dactylosporangium sp. AC04546]|nr:hypothetical protein [Dactylosporangium sp. AC04546]WVK81726.1 hypothetical protein KZZ52_48465 [Dactylosporangium sp. AC04546]
MTPVNTTCSIAAFTPNPLRADGEVHREAGTDADQIGGEVMHAQPDQKLDHDDVDRQRGEAGQTEVGEALQREAAASEGPQFMQDVVGDEGDLDGRDRRGQEGQPEQAVQHEQGDVVHDDTADSHEGEPAEPAQGVRHAPNRADLAAPGASRHGPAVIHTFGLPQSA